MTGARDQPGSKCAAMICGSRMYIDSRAYLGRHDSEIVLVIGEIETNRYRAATMVMERRSRHCATALAVLALVIPAVCSAPPLAQSREAASRRSYRWLYMVGARNLVQIDLTTGTTRVLKLLALGGLQEEENCSSNHVPPTCDWSAEKIVLDPQNRRLYFAAPTTSPGDELDQRDDEDASGRGPFAVWVLDLEGMKLLRMIETSAPSSMLLTADGKQLLVSHDTQVVDTFDTDTFAKISTVKNTGKSPVDAFFPPGSYFLPDRKFIVSGGVTADFRVRIEAGQFRQEFMDPRTQLSAENLKRLQGFVHAEKDGQKLLLAVPVSSRNGKTLVSVVDEGETKEAFWAVDMETGATSTAAVINYLALAQLIGSGNEFVLSEARYVPVPDDLARGPYFDNSGRLAIYDVKSGTMLKEFNRPELKGEGEFLCLSPDGSLAAFVRAPHILTIDFSTSDVKQAATVSNLQAWTYAGACAFTQ
jgi:hypothetical protein